VVSACSGVFVTDGRTLHVCRGEPSNMFAGAIVRRQNVYRLRRYRSAPDDAG